MSLINSHMDINKKVKADYNYTMKLKTPNNLRPFYQKWIKNKNISFEFE